MPQTGRTTSAEFAQDKAPPPERIRHPSAIRERLTKVIHLAINKYTP
ncbi:MAG: hypothetical protein ACYSQY_05345 [Planctomycetota bacterium]